MGISAPKENIYPPPQKFPAGTLPAPCSLRPLGEPPPLWGFSIKKPDNPPPLLALRLPPPLPRAEKIKNIRNVHRAQDPKPEQWLFLTLHRTAEETLSPRNRRIRNRKLQIVGLPEIRAR